MPGPRAAVTDALLARLRTLEPSGVSVYDGEVPTDPPTVEGDEDRRVAPYVVVYGGGGLPRLLDDSVTGTLDDLTTSFQLTCAAGYAGDLRWLVDLVHPLVYLWSPAVPVVAGRFRVPDGYDPGTARRDEAVRPVRHWLPLQYQLDTTA